MSFDTLYFFFFFSSRRRHTRLVSDWSSDVCSSDLAYWHGVFGGCYLPHLRRAVKTSLLEAERTLVEAAAASETAWTREDGDGDGRVEVYVRTRALAVTLEPEAGGMVTELGYFPAGLDVADVLARRAEAYHDKVRARAAAPTPTAGRTIHDADAAKEAGLDA